MSNNFSFFHFFEHGMVAYNRNCSHLQKNYILEYPSHMQYQNYLLRQTNGIFLKILGGTFITLDNVLSNNTNMYFWFW